MVKRKVIVWFCAILLVFVMKQQAVGAWAIAVGTEDDAWGSAIRSNMQAASEAARDNCEMQTDRLCEVVMSSTKRCGALFMTNDGGWGVGEGEQPSVAQAIARRECEIGNPYETCYLDESLCE